jgi:hypoxia-inducible factor prolyl hydroxylase
MITCYPGGGTAYSRHIDNAIGNGRKLTCILYLNARWKEGDGGELKIYHLDGSGREQASVVSPLLNRLLLFWSDKRCPHEVSIEGDSILSHTQSDAGAVLS